MKYKKLAALFLIIALISAYLVPSAMAFDVPTEADIYQRIIALEDTYPSGTPWTNDDGYRTNGALGIVGARGCAGFAYLVSDAAFGYLPGNLLRNFTYADIHVGDIVRIYNNYHTVVVLEKHPSYVTVVEGNWGGTVQWGRIVKRSDIEAGDYVITRYPTGTFNDVEETLIAFSDVSLYAYYAEAVEWAYYRNPQITNGIGGGKFGPNDTVIRRDAVTFLWRAKGRPEPKQADSGFIDVEKGSYYEKAVIWAVENGITTGVAAGKFDPTGTLTNDQMITFIWRALGEPGEKNTGTKWYSDAENWAKGENLMDGTGKVYKHDDECPRADVVYYMYQAR